VQTMKINNCPKCGQPAGWVQGARCADAGLPQPNRAAWSAWVVCGLCEYEGADDVSFEGAEDAARLAIELWNIDEYDGTPHKAAP
jgi:ribosomal protein L37E